MPREPFRRETRERCTTRCAELLSDRAALREMAQRAREAAAGPYSWREAAGRTLDLYETLRARGCPRMIALEILFWLSCALIVWTQAGYALALALIARLVRPGPGARPAAGPLPRLTLIVAAHDEESVIEAKVANALSLDYPRELLEVIVACDGCTDSTAAAARARGSRRRARAARAAARSGRRTRPCRRAQGELVAFSDANALWEPDAAQVLVGAFADPRVGYACGQVRFVQAASGPDAGNQEGLYWRYELAVRGP